MVKTVKRIIVPVSCFYFLFSLKYVTNSLENRLYICIILIILSISVFHSYLEFYGRVIFGHLLLVKATFWSSIILIFVHL